MFASRTRLSGVLRGILIACAVWLSIPQSHAGWTTRPEPGLSSAGLAGEPQAIALSETARVAGIGLREAKAVAFVNIDTGVLLGQVALTRTPSALVFDAAGTRAYVLCEDSNLLAVIDVAARSVAATWTIGAQPVALAFDPARTQLVVADVNERRLRALDPATGAQLRGRTLDFGPRQLAFSANGQRLVVGGKGLLVGLDAASLSEITRVSVGDDIRSLAWWDFGALALAVGKKQDALNLIDTETGTITARIALDGDPDSVALSQSEDRAFVSTREDLSVNRVELGPRSLSGRYPLPGRAGGVAFDPVTRVLLVTQPKDDLLLKLDPAQASLIAVLTLSKRLRDIAVNNVTHEAVAIADKSDVLSRIRLADRSVQSLALPATPQQVKVDTGLNRAVLSLRKTKDQIGFVDLAGTAPSVYPQRIDLPDEIRAIAVDSTRALTIVLTAGSQRIHLVDNASRALVASLPSNEKLVALAIHSGRGLAYLVAEDKKLLVLDLATRTLTHAVWLGFKVDAIAVDEALERAVLTSAQGERAYVLDLATLAPTASFVLPRNPGEVAIQPDTHVAVVTSRESDALSLIDLQTLQPTAGFSALPKPSRLALTTRYNQALALSAERDEIAFVALPNPAPVLTQVVPSQVATGTPAIALMLFGARFIDGAKAYLGTSPLLTRWQSPTLLYADVPAAQLQTARRVWITVVHPGPGGGSSNALAFDVLPPPPTLSTVSPSSFIASGETQALSVTGTNFVPAAQIVFGAQALAAQYVSATQLTATVPGSLLAEPGSAEVSVLTSGGQSNRIGVTLESPLPVIERIDPTRGGVGSVVTINGRGFYPTASDNQVRFAGTAAAAVLAATRTQLSVKVPASALTGPITVATPRGSATGPTFTVIREQDFALVVNPAQLRLLQGARTSASIELSSLGTQPFTGLAALSIAGLPSGVSAAFVPANLSLTQTGTLLLEASASATPGSYLIGVSGSALVSGLIQSRSANFTLVLEAATGVTGVKGRFVTPDGRGIAGVIVRADTGAALQPQSATDAAGNFLLTGLPAGTITLRMDATPANPLYPIWPYNVTLTSGVVLVIPDWTIDPPPTEDKFTAIANATQDQIVSDARFPGLAVTLPAGVQIVGWDGVVKTRVALERRDVDRLPVPPPPANARSAYQLYFGTPSGGIPSAPIPVALPNDLGLEPGDSADIWYFDGSPMGGAGEWKIAGTGTVNAQGSSIVSDPGSGIPRFCGVCGLMCPAKDKPAPPRKPAPNPKPPCKPTDPCCQDQSKPKPSHGHAVTIATGQELISEVDLSCSGAVPVGINRRFNPLDAFNNVAGTAGSLGLAWVMNYDVVLLPFTGPQKRVVLPGNEPVNFIDDGSATYRNGTDLRFAGAAMTQPDSSTWQLSFSDGEIWRFNAFPGVPGKIRGGAPYFLTEIVYPQGEHLLIQRNSVGRALSVGTPERSLHFAYGANNFVSQVNDPLGRTVRYTYNAADRLETIIDAQGGLTRYTYVDDSELPALPACPNVEGGTRIKSIVRPGNSTAQELFYGPGRRVLREVLEDQSENRFSYKLVGACVTHVSDPALRCTGNCPTEDSWENFQAGWRISGGQVMATTVIDARGNRYTQRFNPTSQGSEEIDAAGQTTRYVYDSHARMTSETDALGRTWRYSYDDKGNLLRSIDPLNRTTDIAYDPRWNKPSSVTRYLEDGTPVTTGLAYDAGRGTLLRITDALGNTTRMSYSARGQLEAISLPQPGSAGGERSVRFEYNAAGDLSAAHDPLGNSARFVTDAAGRTVRAADALGYETATGYNGISQPTTLTDALGGLTRWSYNAQQLLDSVVDARGNTLASYRYDALGRLSARTDANLIDETYRYDANGNLSEFTDRKGQLTRLTYDERDRVIRIERPDGVETRSYDALGRLIQVHDGSGSIGYAYDAVDRVIRQTQVANGQSHEIEYAYDALDRRIRRTLDGIDSTEYRYDLAGRLIEIGYRAERTVYAWDAAGRLTGKTLPNGMQTLYSYDDADRVTQIAYRKGDASLIEQLDYQYDANGQRISKSAVSNIGTAETPFSALYDQANRLTQITLKGTGPGGLDQTCSLAYDANGNLASKTCPDGVSTYTWDSRDRLSAIAGPGLSASFQYDALGRRLRRSVNGETTTYVYDGLQAIAETRNNLPSTLLTGLAIDEVIARYSEQTQRVFLTDALGTVIAQAQADQTLQNTYGYSPYGQVTSTGNDQGNSVQYTARENDATGLYFYRARYYDPVLKRFVSEDPIGLNGGVNLYAYVDGDPIFGDDPLGLAGPIHYIAPRMVVDVHDPGASAWSGDVHGPSGGGGTPNTNVGKPSPTPAVAPAIKPGSAGGPTAGRRFPQNVISAAKAENPGAICVYCKTPGSATQVDHAIARARGGNSSIFNAQLACPHCNASKGARNCPVNPPPGYVGPWPPPWWEQ